MKPHIILFRSVSGIGLLFACTLALYAGVRIKPQAPATGVALALTAAAISPKLPGITSARSP